MKLFCWWWLLVGGSWGFGLFVRTVCACASMKLDLFGLLASPLCGAAVTFFAAAKKVTKESSYGVSGVRT